MTSFILSPLEQYDLLNLKDWGFFGYAFSYLFTNTNAQFFLVLSLGILSLFFVHYNYNGFWLTPELMVLTFRRFTPWRPLPHARYSAVTLAAVVHLLSVAFFGMLSQKYCLGFDVASLPLAQAVVAQPVSFIPALAAVAPILPKLKLSVIILPLPTFVLHEVTADIVADLSFTYKTFWSLPAASQLTQLAMLHSTAQYGTLELLFNPGMVTEPMNLVMLDHPIMFPEEPRHELNLYLSDSAQCFGQVRQYNDLRFLKQLLAAHYVATPV